MSENIKILVDKLDSKNNKVRKNALDTLLGMTQDEVDWVYEIWGILVDKLSSSAISYWEGSLVKISLLSGNSRDLMEKELNHIEKMNLTIGMHYIDKFTEAEYKTALDLNNYLCSNGCGEVRLVTSFWFHGKIYSYS